MRRRLRSRIEVSNTPATDPEHVWKRPEKLPILQAHTNSPTHWLEERYRRQQRVDQSIQDLDELLVRIKEKHLIRSRSVVKGGQGLVARERRRSVGRMLPRLDLSAIVR